MLLANALIMWAHLIAASIWVGGSIFIGIVLAPLLKTFSDSVEGRLSIMIRVGRRFNVIGVPSLIVLILTGIYNSIGILEKPSLILGTNYGIVLLIKVILVMVLIIIFAIHVRLIRTEVERKIESQSLSGDNFCCYIANGITASLRCLRLRRFLPQSRHLVFLFRICSRSFLLQQKDLSPSVLLFVLLEIPKSP